MSAISLVIALQILAADPPPASAKVIERLQALHTSEAKRWQFFVDEGHKTQAKLVEKPIYVWSNPTRSNVQHGLVLVWTDRGRPVAIGSIFSHPETGKRMICHEFHSMSEGVLQPERGELDQTWIPQAPVAMQRLP